MYKIIENKKQKTYYVVDCVTGKEIANTENPESAKRILANLTDYNYLMDYESIKERG